MIICFENVPTVLKHLNDTLQTTDLKENKLFDFKFSEKLNSFPAPPRLPSQIYRQMYEQLEKLTERLLAKLPPSNLVNTISQLVF